MRKFAKIFLLFQYRFGGIGRTWLVFFDRGLQEHGTQVRRRVPRLQLQHEPIADVAYRAVVGHNITVNAMSALSIEYDRLMTDRKRRLFDELESLKDARGDGRLVLLEIGCGGGHNFKYYPDGSQVIGPVVRVGPMGAGPRWKSAGPQQK